MRRSPLVLAAAALAAATVSACGSAPSGGVRLVPAVEAAATTSMNALGPVGEISAVRIQPVRAGALANTAGSSTAWMAMLSSARGYLAEERARWVAGMMIAEVWKARHDLGDDSLAGGSLADMTSDARPDGSGMTLTLGPELQRIMFTSQDGATPSPLIVTDRAAYTARVAAAAAAAGLRVTSVRFTQSRGTVVQIDEVADNPVAFLKRYGRTNPGLTLDPNAVEGVMLVVRDRAGAVVMTSAWSTGSQSGEGGPGPTYGDVATS